MDNEYKTSHHSREHGIVSTHAVDYSQAAPLVGIPPPPINATLQGDPSCYAPAIRRAPRVEMDLEGGAFHTSPIKSCVWKKGGALHKFPRLAAALKNARLPPQSMNELHHAIHGEKRRKHPAEHKLNVERIKGGEPLPMTMPQGSQQALEEVGRFPDLPASGVLLYNFGERPEDDTEPIGPEPNTRKRSRPGAFARPKPFA